MKKNVFNLLIIIVLVLLGGCHSKKELAILPVAENTAKNLFVNEALGLQPQFITANIGKLQMKVSLSGKEVSAGGTCKIYRDSVIQLSIQPFMGIEMFKLELLPEAIYLFDKTSQNYYHLVYEELAEMAGLALTFYDFQALFSNQLFAVGNTDLDKIVAEKKGNTLIYSYKTGDILQKTSFSDKHIRLVEVAEGSKNFLFNTTYGNFQKDDNVNFPHTIDFQFVHKKRVFKLKINIEKIEFNREMRVVLTNPLRYKAGNLHDLLNNPLF